jgi:CRISPR/Cas system-associated endonuclease Cas1
LSEILDLTPELAPGLQLARESIRAKIHNPRVMLMRNGEVPDRVLQLLAGFRDSTQSAREMTELLGIEGTAAAIYFEQFVIIVLTPSQLTNKAGR